MTANDGGACETWDGGKHWIQKSTISAQQFYDVSVDNELPYNVMGGTQDNGCWIGPSQTRNQWGVFARDWTYLPSGDGFYVVRDWWNPEYIYWESQFGSSMRRNLRTGAMIPLARRTTPEERDEGKPEQRYQWNAPIVLSPHNPGIVFVCSQFVHRVPEPGRAEHLADRQPGPHQGRQVADRAVEENQSPVPDDLHLRRIAQDAWPLLGRHGRRQRPDEPRRGSDLGQCHGPVL